MKKDIGLLALQLTPVVLILLGTVSIFFAVIKNNADFTTPGNIMAIGGWLFIYFFYKYEKSHQQLKDTQKQPVSAFEGIFQIEIKESGPRTEEINTITSAKKDEAKIVDLKKPVDKKKDVKLPQEGFEKTIEGLFAECRGKENSLEYFETRLKELGYDPKLSGDKKYVTIMNPATFKRKGFAIETLIENTKPRSPANVQKTLTN